MEMKWNLTDGGTGWVLETSTPFYFEVAVFCASNGAYHYRCRGVGLGLLQPLQACTLPAAKAEALTLVTNRLKAVIEQLEQAPLK